MNCLECWKNEKFFCFLGGAVAATLGVKALKSNTTRMVCVSGLAKGMKIHRDAQAVFQNMKEDAQDLCYDAKMEAGLTGKEAGEEITEE